MCINNCGIRSSIHLNTMIPVLCVIFGFLCSATTTAHITFTTPIPEKGDCETNEISRDFDSACSGEITEIDFSYSPLNVDLSGLNLKVIPRPPHISYNTKILDVSHNQIANTSDELHELSSLQVLRLEDNSLTNLHFLPNNYWSLLRLNVSHNSLSTLDGIERCENLEVLDISNNPSVLLSEHIFFNLKLLQHLEIMNSELQDLPDNIFMHQEHLRVLNLHGNKLTLPADIFDFTPRISHLLLSANDMSELPYGLFANMNCLKHLNLNDNQLTTIIGGTFAKSPILQQLNLESNHLEQLRPGSLAGLEQLQILNLDNNHLTELSSIASENLASLKFLSAINNRIAELVPYNASVWPLMRVADLRMNRITGASEPVLRSWFEPGRCMFRHLHLGGNMLQPSGALRSVLADPDVGAVRTERCHCGKLHKQHHYVAICLALPCANDTSVPGNWIEALRTEWTPQDLSDALHLATPYT